MEKCLNKFKIGQRVKIVDETVAKGWLIEPVLGHEFMVDNIDTSGGTITTGYFAPEDGKSCPWPWHVPVTACILVEEAQDNIATYTNILKEICHKASYDAGWWHDAAGNFTKDNALTFSNKLMLIVSEIAEAMEGDRKDKMDDHLPHRKAAEVELADALIRIFDLGGAYNFDLGGAMQEKMLYNKSRKDHSKEARESANGKKY